MNELRWMNWHNVRHENPPLAVDMLQRRLRDEPLAYILGIALSYISCAVLIFLVR